MLSPPCKRGPSPHPTPAVALACLPSQYNALLLLLFTVITPFAVGAFTSSQSCAQGPLVNGETRCDSEWGTILLSAFFSSVIVGSFNAMWLVANEMEDPFGMEPNDICMMDFHHEFCALLQV